MPADNVEKTELLRFLGAIGRELERGIRVNAVGGTALTLLGVKPSTRDIDFDTSSPDHDVLKKAVGRLSPGYPVDLFTDGFIFSQRLPEDYLAACKPISKLTNIGLYTISPLDVVCTKIGRLNERDIQDIRLTIAKFGLTPQEVKRRAQAVEYVGNQENFDSNLEYTLENLFK
ncbi:MAG: DUF6036 family nucleotidyltransferase [Candidatus Micrarchaeota archaeon]